MGKISLDRDHGVFRVQLVHPSDVDRQRELARWANFEVSPYNTGFHVERAESNRIT